MGLPWAKKEDKSRRIFTEPDDFRLFSGLGAVMPEAPLGRQVKGIESAARDL